MDFAVAPYLLDQVLTYLSFGGAGVLAWRFVRAYERRSAGPRQVRALAQRVRLLEATLGRVEARVEDTAEAQRFTTQVLMPRTPSTRHDLS